MRASWARVKLARKVEARVSWDTAASLVVRYRVVVGHVREGTCRMVTVKVQSQSSKSP